MSFKLPLSSYSFFISIQFTKQKDQYNDHIETVFLKVFSRIENRVPDHRVPRIRQNRVPRIRQNRVPAIRGIESLQVNTGYQTFSFKKNYIENK